MLRVVLLLVLFAGLVLVGAVLAGEPGLAWLSVIACGVAATLQAMDRKARAEAELRPAAEPAEERSNAAEAADPDADVLVIDERPRYHVRTCEWIAAAVPVGAGSVTDSPGTIQLKLREARDLGFTPCAQCAPNATIAAERLR